MVETGLLGREPLLKYAIFLCCGSASVGIFELASKIPASIRQVFLYGLGALMPAFAKLDQDGAPSNIIRLGQDALRYIFFGAIGALFLYLLNANQLLNLWLGSTNDELLIMTILMTFWWMATSVNVPAWWLGIGIGSVWPNTLIAGFHFILALGLVCLTWIISFDSLTLVFLWVICGIGMQILLYTLMEWKTKMIKSMYLSREMALVFTAFITVTGMTFLCHFWLRRVFFSPATVLISSVLFFYLQVIALMLIIRLREGR
jgi:O-antigen/teichoic acid export membrane protein